MIKNDLIRVNILFLSLSLILSIYLLGFRYFDPTNTSWLFWGDLPTLQTGWNYFRIDEWRFPIFSNPNYGIYLNNNLIYSDSIPLFALFFKIFNFILPDNFQYFSLWILFSIYLQGLISYLIIFRITKSINFSLVGSIFFIFSTIMIHRITEYPQLSGHWIILLFLYTELLDKNKKFISQNIVILLSLLIQFYFTLILLMIFFINQFYNLILKQKSLNSVLKHSFLVLISAIVAMFIFGYFQISPDDGLGWGYGFYNLNLNSFFNPSGETNTKISWSNFLSDKPLQNGEMEGFSYLGVSGIIFLVLFLKHIFFEKKNIIFKPRSLLLITVIIFFLSLSNNINFGDATIINYPLNKYFYALASLFRSSGRFVWPIYYFIFIIGIISIYVLFPKKNIVILSILLSFQLIDLSSGLKHYFNGNQYKVSSEDKYIDYEYWIKISKQFENLRLLKPKNNTAIYKNLSPIIIKNYFKSTDVVYLSRVNREKIAEERYNIKNKIIDKDLSQFENTLFVTDDISIINYFFHNLYNQIYIYKHKDIWLLSKKEILHIEPRDLSYFSEIPVLNLNKKNTLSILNPNLPKLGFDYDVKKKLILDGKYGVINFKLTGNNCNKYKNIKINFEPFYNESFLESDFEIEMNYKKKSLKLINNSINFKFNCISNYTNHLKIISNKLFSQYDKKIGLNRLKRSILINSIIIY
jgi:hypothetical protein